MAKRKKDTTKAEKTTKKKVEIKVEEKHNFKPGDIIVIESDKLPGNVLGSIYTYNDLKVRVVYIGIDKCKLEVL